MADATVTLDVLETLDVTGNNALEVTLYVVVAVDLVTELFELCIGQVFDPSCWVDTGCLADITCVLRTNTVDVGQTDLNLFLCWDSDVSYSRHNLTLPLFIFRLLFVDDIEAAFAAYQLVIWTDFFDTGSNLHSANLPGWLNLFSQSEADSALRKIVRGQLNFDLIARH